MTALPVWAGVIVTDLAVAVRWYAETTRAQVVESTERWASLAFRDGSGFELHLGDPERPGLTFPSYGSNPGPCVMPGFSVDDVEAAAEGLVVARSLPGWIVVAAPGDLRVVLADRDSEAGEGLIGFAFATPGPAELRSFLEHIGADGEVERSGRTRVVPVVVGSDDAELADPEGNPLRVVRPRAARGGGR